MPGPGGRSARPAAGPWVALALLGALAAGPARADVPGPASLAAALAGYGDLSATVAASPGPGGEAVAYISLTAEIAGSPYDLPAVPAPSGPEVVQDALPACGALTLTAQAVDSAGDTGPASAAVYLYAPCGPTLSSYGPSGSPATGEALAWTPASGQTDADYIVAASPGPGTASDPLPLVLTVTAQDSYTYTFTTGPAGTAGENLLYRVYAVEADGVTSPAASGDADAAYSFAPPAFAAFTLTSATALAASTPAFQPVGPDLSLTYTLYAGPSPTGAFTALTAVAAASVTPPVSVSLGSGPGAGQYYYWSVGDGSVSSPNPPPAAGLLFAPALGVPALSVPADTSSGVELAWPPVAGAAGYAVLRTDLSWTAQIVSSPASGYAPQGGLLTTTDSSSYGPGPDFSLGPLAYAVQAYAAPCAGCQVFGPPSASASANNPQGAAPPAGLTATATGAPGSVALAWSQAFPAPGPASSYDVYYSTTALTPLAPGVTRTVVPSTQTSLTVTAFPSGAPLPDGVLAWFWVASDNGGGPGPFLPPASAVPHTAPLAPTLTAGVLAFGQGVSLSVALTGTPDVPLAAVDVYASSAPANPLAVLPPTAPSLTLTAADFPCGSAVTLSVQAVDVLGDTGPASAGVWLEPPCAPALTATGLSSGQLALQWTTPAAAGPLAYALYEATGPGWPDGQGTLVTVTSADSAIAPAAPGASPHFSVAAVDAFGVTSPASSRVALLEPPTGLAAAPASGAVTLSWSAPPAAGATGLGGYRVYYSSAPAFLDGGAAFGVSPGALSLTLPAAAQGAKIGSLANLAPYAFAVAALDSSGAVSGAASAAVTATTGPAGPALATVATYPVLPSITQFGPLTVTGSGDAAIPGTPPTSVLQATWSNGAYAPIASTVYTLYEADDPTATPQTFNTLTPVASAPSGATSLTFTAGLSGPAWYFLDVTDASGTDDGGDDTTDARSVAAALFAPNLAPVALTLGGPVASNRVTLAWSGVPYAGGYRIYRATQDLPVPGAAPGQAETALSTSLTAATFTLLARVGEQLGAAQDFDYTDTDPVANSANAYEVVPDLTLPAGGEVFGPASNAVTVTPETPPQDPGFWAWPGGNDGSVVSVSTGGDYAGPSGYYVTAAATASGGVFLEWTQSGAGTFPVSAYRVYRGYSLQGLTPLATVPAGAFPARAEAFTTDPAPPQPVSALVYGVSALDTQGDASPDIITATVQAPLAWPAPVQAPDPGLAGLCPGGYCSGTKAVTLTWAPGMNLTEATLTNGGGAVTLTQSTGTFPFASWIVSRVAAPGAPPVVLAGPGAWAGADVSVSAGGIAVLTQTTLTDLSPVAGSPAYVIAAVDSQGNVGAPLAVSVSVPTGPERIPPLAVAGLTAAPAVAPSLPPAPLAAQLAWTPNAPQDDVGVYEVWRQDPGGNTELTQTAQAGYLDTYADPAGRADGAGTEVTYTVRALDTSGVYGPFSAPLDYVLAPPAPASLSLTADIPLGVSLSPAVGLVWQDVLGLVGAPAAGQAGQGSYTVLRTLPGQGAQPLSGCVGLTAAAGCADESPAASATYQVESVVTSGAGPVASPSLSPALAAAVPLQAPAPPSAVSAAVSGGGVELTWSPEPPPASEYWIYRSSAPLSSSPPYADFLGRTQGDAFLDTGTSPTVGGPASLEPYYAVAAASPWAVGTALTLTAGLAPPTGLSAWAGGTGSPPAVSATVTLAWESATAAAVTGYGVWRAYEGPSGLTGTAYLASVSVPAYTDVLQGSAASLTGTPLDYWVTSLGGGLPGPASAAVTVTAYGLPSPPRDLAGQGIAGGVEASWKPAYAAQGVTAYALAWNVLGGGPSGTTLVAAGQPQWSLSPLLLGQSVTVTVQALNSAGASAAAGPLTLDASAVVPPPPPAGLAAASGLTPGAQGPPVGVALAISDTGEAALILYRSPAPGAALPASPTVCAPLALSLCAGGAASPYYLTTLAGAPSSYFDSAVTPGYAYSYAATALGPLGLPGQESLPTASNPLTLTAYAAWAAPSLSGSAGNGVVSLWWSPPAPAGQGSYPLAGYRLYRQTAGGLGVDPGFPVALPPTTGAYSDTAVTNLSTYTYWISSVDLGGYSSPTSTVGSLVPMGILPPPTSLSAVPGNSSVSLTWVVPQSDVFSGATYNVYRRLTSPGATYGAPLPNLFHVSAIALPNFPVAVSLVAQTAVDGSGLPTSPPNLVTQCYCVSAVDAAGEGPKSPETCVTPFYPLDPNEWGLAQWPTPSVTISESSGSQQSEVNVTLQFKPIPAAGNSGQGGYATAGYEISRSANSGSTYTQLGFVPETATASPGGMLDYVDTVPKGQSYLYKIQPVDTGGNPGLPYDLQGVQVPSGQNALYVYRNSFDPMQGGSVPIQVGLQQSGNFWVRVYTLNGEYVQTVIPTTYSFGTSGNPYLSTVYSWDGRNSKGQVVASGVYLIHLQGPGFKSDALVAVIK